MITCPVGSCQRHQECMYVNHPQCTAKLDARRGQDPREDWRSSELAPPARTQEQTAAWMGYEGPDAVAQMNAHHDRIHEQLAELSGGHSHSLGVARDATTSEQDHAVAAYEEDAVLHLQRYLVRSGRMDSFLGAQVIPPPFPLAR